MSSDDPISSVAKGVTEGFLEWSSDELKSFIRKLKDKKLAFIQDEETIKTVKELYRSGELSFYNKYIDDKEILFLIQMGLTLRKLDKEGKDEKRNNLRNKIFNKYKIRGLHISQFVENGIFNRYIGIIIDNITSLEEFKTNIVNILENIEKHVLFVQTPDKERVVIQTALTKISSHSPSIFIISGILSAANTVKKCEKKLEKLLKDYELEKISSGQKENLFFKRILRKE